MDIKQAEYKIPKIQYEVYYPLNHDSKLCLLNLSICEDIDIDIYLPLELKENINLYDPNSDFYNDICATYTSENGTDLTLSDRKNIFVNDQLINEYSNKLSLLYRLIHLLNPYSFDLFELFVSLL